MENYHEIVPRFVCALGYLALAAIAWLARRQRGSLHDEVWLTVGGVALAGAQVTVIVTTIWGGAPIWDVLRLCLYSAVLATLAEYGRLVQVYQPKLSIGRTAVAVLLFATVPAVLSVNAAWLEVVIRLLIAWQGGLIVGPRVWTDWRAAQGSNLAACVQLRWRSPALFMLLLVVGATVLHRSIVVPAGVDLNEIEVAAEPQDFEPGPLARESTAGVATQLIRCGLAMFSLLALLVVVILLSRVPGLR
jgi:hypothetical protein